MAVGHIVIGNLLLPLSTPEKNRFRKKLEEIITTRLLEAQT